MTKQILAFLFCFTRELNPYNPPYPLNHPPRALSLWLNRVARRSEHALAFKDSTNPLPHPYLHPSLRALSLWLNRVKDSTNPYSPLTFSL